LFIICRVVFLLFFMLYLRLQWTSRGGVVDFTYCNETLPGLVENAKHS